VDALLVRPDDLGVPTGRAMIVDLDVSFRIHLAAQLDSIGAEDNPAPIAADATEQQHERMTRRLRGSVTALLGRFTGIPTALVPGHAHHQQRAYQGPRGCARHEVMRTRANAPASSWSQIRRRQPIRSDPTTTFSSTPPAWRGGARPARSTAAAVIHVPSELTSSSARRDGPAPRRRGAPVTAR